MKRVKELNEEISNLKKELEKKKAGIANYMGEHGKLVAGNQPLITFNSDKNGTRVFKVKRAK